MAPNSFAQIILVAMAPVVIAWIWAELRNKATLIRIVLGVLQTILAVVGVYILIDLKEATREHYDRQIIAELDELVSAGDFEILKQRIHDYCRVHGIRSLKK